VQDFLGSNGGRRGCLGGEANPRSHSPFPDGPRSCSPASFDSSSPSRSRMHSPPQSRESCRDQTPQVQTRVPDALHVHRDTSPISADPPTRSPNHLQTHRGHGYKDAKDLLKFINVDNSEYEAVVQEMRASPAKIHAVDVDINQHSLVGLRQNQVGACGCLCVIYVCWVIGVWRWRSQRCRAPLESDH